MGSQSNPQNYFCEIWKVDSEIYMEKKSGKESQDYPREKNKV